VIDASAGEEGSGEDHRGEVRRGFLWESERMRETRGQQYGMLSRVRRMMFVLAGNAARWDGYYPLQRRGLVAVASLSRLDACLFVAKAA